MFEVGATFLKVESMRQTSGGSITVAPDRDVIKISPERL